MSKRARTDDAKDADVGSDQRAYTPVVTALHNHVTLSGDAEDRLRNITTDVNVVIPSDVPACDADGVRAIARMLSLVVMTQVRTPARLHSGPTVARLNGRKYRISASWSTLCNAQVDVLTYMQMFMDPGAPCTHVSLGNPMVRIDTGASVLFISGDFELGGE